MTKSGQTLVLILSLILYGLGMVAAALSGPTIGERMWRGAAISLLWLIVGIELIIGGML